MAEGPVRREGLLGTIMEQLQKFLLRCRCRSMICRRNESLLAKSWVSILTAGQRGL